MGRTKGNGRKERNGTIAQRDANKSTVASAHAGEHTHQEDGVAVHAAGHSRVRSILVSIERARKFAVNLAVTLLAIFGTVAVVQATWHQSVLLDPIRVPKELSDLGYTDEVVSRHIRDHITEVGRLARTSKTGGVLAVLWTDPDGTHTAATRSFQGTLESKLPEFEMSFSGVSLGTLVSLVRNVIGISDTKIGGDVTVDPTTAGGSSGDARKNHKYRLTLRVNDRPLDVTDGQVSDSLDKLFRHGAVRIVEHIDPYIAAAYLFQNGDPEAATRQIAICLITCTAEYGPWLLNLRGSIARSQKYSQAALNDYSAAIDKDKNFSLAYYNRALVHLDDGNFIKGFEDAKLGLEREINYQRRAIGLNNAGRALFHQRRLTEALEYFEQSSAADQKYALAYYNQGLTLRDLRKLEEARAKFEMTIAFDQKNAEAFNQLGLLLLADEQWEPAGKRFRSAADLRPSVAPYLYNIGRALRGHGQHDSAIAAFEKATTLDPKHAWSYAHWGAVLAHQSRNADGGGADSKDALLKLTKALEIQPKNSFVLKEVGAAYEILGMYQEALKLYQTPEVNAPELRQAATRLQQTLAKQ
jgi:tetratricopeptide (TPR) repeat protein